MNIRAHYISRLLQPSEAFWGDQDSDSDSEDCGDGVPSEAPSKAISSHDAHMSLVPLIHIQAPEDNTDDWLSKPTTKEDGSRRHHHKISGLPRLTNATGRASGGSGSISDNKDNGLMRSVLSHEVRSARHGCISDQKSGFDLQPMDSLQSPSLIANCIDHTAKLLPDQASHSSP